ncbi:MAG: Flp pilus assembly complex ATPase component TadA, partial [Deltaproteobacteria bacterium]|nr:Flp pilus assembly complex ATPase component TadA [Deltaproteobacteria bacterium]
ASLSGHLVFTTLHTNDAVGAVPRLLDMGVEPYLLASSLALSMGQRLVRVICKSCKEQYQPEKSQLSALGLEEKESFVRGRGCGRCFRTGYKGRIGIFEALSISGPVREFIMARADSNSIKQQALKEGLVTMMDDGRDKVRRGLTTVEEVIRVAHTI